MCKEDFNIKFQGGILSDISNSIKRDTPVLDYFSDQHLQQLRILHSYVEIDGKSLLEISHKNNIQKLRIEFADALDKISHPDAQTWRKKYVDGFNAGVSVTQKFPASGHSVA